MNLKSPTPPPLPRLAVTLGDVAGIGPEVTVRALCAPEIRAACMPVIFGDVNVLQGTVHQLGMSRQVVALCGIGSLAAVNDESLYCYNAASIDVSGVPLGGIDRRAGQAAYDWLVSAAQAALAGQVDAIVTAPLSKAALKAAGLEYPGHTEILAEQCGVSDFAMMLYLPPGTGVRGEFGLGVAHVTLHTSLASVPKLLSQQGVQQKIHLVHRFLTRMGAAAPRVGVCALNPHAGEEGLFGDEESRIIFPAVAAARAMGVLVEGPLPADALLRRAAAGEFDGVVAMYHDQGHIALKLIGFNQAVNVTLGLPIVRTSPSHGTAFDIAGQGLADSSGMEQAIKVALQLAATRESL